ncbi:MAG: DUF262 domain-containing protein [Clostridiales bacterium]|nr:DUF262 domain-containing protein [Clostridiales bacterium]
MAQKYAVHQQSIEILLSWIQAGEIAIPEIQRPFVWDAVKVRDLMDSLYQGYPIGYLIAWKNPDVKLKDGSVSSGKKILIDGQQRVTALTAAILGQPVVNKDYKKVKIKIAFNPISRSFEVCNTAIEKDVQWIPDISEVMKAPSMMRMIKNYCDKNTEADEEEIEKSLVNLKEIKQKQIGIIELNHDLDIETVTEIFIRINSQGVPLSQADFAMSKIAANETYNGNVLRKAIDYFCHLAVEPQFYDILKEGDEDFTRTEYFSKMSWLKNENDDLYDPSYTDLLRVSFTSEFERGKLADLVSLLSGRNFETRTYEEDIARESFERLSKSTLRFMNENNFKSFIMIIKSAGFVSSDLIGSQNALNFAYALYLKMKGKYRPEEINNAVKKWFVMSILTSRYSGSAETMFDYDIKNISTKGVFEYLKDIENANLSDAFWQFELVQRLETSVKSSPIFNVFLAALIKGNYRGFLSKDISVKDLILHKGDVHHVFPRDYLKKNGLNRGRYNQVANYVIMQSEINIQIGNKPPKDYMDEMRKQCESKVTKYGNIIDEDDLINNLRENCIPEELFDMGIEEYDKFLDIRRRLIAERIEKYYKSL